MSTGEHLSFEPQELQFPFELKKQISCSLQLTNKTDNYVAFKVKTTNPKKYCVRPNTGILLPHSNCDVTVTMQAQKEAPPDMQCKDKFLLQSVVASPGATAKDITPEMFNKDSGESSEFTAVSRAYGEPQDNSLEVKAIISKLTEEKISAIQQNNKLQQELEFLRHKGNRSRGGIPFIYVVLVGLLGILLGYLMKK
ncbi:hypothetical protein F0562_014740 [Nyssa sinensis]|uniref:MSP domain-containing protein n=1 Tax=Nyssa sinensis TaxID=561372 RepID=A0A5J4ZRM9_9ASTE|nr:hypothetical protein F0562_014740 [Nyssa sinensis]